MGKKFGRTLKSVRANFLNPINVICPVQPSPQKYTSSRRPQISPTTPPVPSPPRGAYRDRHGRWAGNAVDAAAPAALDPDRRAGFGL